MLASLIGILLPNGGLVTITSKSAIAAQIHFVTTAPAAITTLLPIVMPGKMVTFAPIRTSFPIETDVATPRCCLLPREKVTPRLIFPIRAFQLLYSNRLQNFFFNMITSTTMAATNNTENSMIIG